MQIKSYPILGTQHKDSSYCKLDLSINSDLFDADKPNNWEQKLADKMLQNPDKVYYGGYLEERFFYLNEELFGRGEERRKYHLGIDFWQAENTQIYAPLEGEIFGMAYNNQHLDYGYTIILKHQDVNRKFYTLYGHLSAEHTKRLSVGDHVKRGQVFCKIGNKEENGGWLPHLHFQWINDLGDYKSDYPGVSNSNDLDFYKENCPDPIDMCFLK